MAATAFSLHLRTTRPSSRNPTLLLHFSSSTSSPPPPPSTSSPPESTSSPPASTSSPPPNPNPNTDTFSSYFSDVKSSLTNSPQKRFSDPPPPPRQQQQQQAASIDQIRRDLSEFRRRTAPPESPLNPARPISFQELYQRNVTNKEGDSSNQMNKGRGISFDAIADGLRQMKAKNSKTNQDPLSLRNLKENFMLRPADPRNPPFVMGSPRKLPETSFSREWKENDGNTSPEMKTEFVKMYSYKELGEKLRKLRPEGKPEDGFSLQELNDRLIKLREMEERESTAKIGKVPFMELRQSLHKMQSAEDEKKQKQFQAFTVFNQIPAYMEKPPKEHLVEKYFHPDNMSSAEKLKIELQKVRDEFKMSESDCGSARVQVAQLTTKIKHLTTALHKKDTHSRKGLQGMIQQRKKLLKYLRRTDWDSYTLVLSKFGLRDNPDHKRLPTKEKKIRKA